MGLLLIQSTVYGQMKKNLSKKVKEPKKIQLPTYGFKTGILFSNITGDEAISRFSKKLGAQVGMFGALYFTHKFSIVGELVYEGKGAKFDNHKMKITLHYASLPIYFKYNFTKDPQIYTYAGVYGAYLLAAKTTGTYELSIEDNHIIEDIDENIRPNLTSYDAGTVLGIGVQGQFSFRLDIFADIRYTQGLISLDKETAEHRYNFNYTRFWPEQKTDYPINRSFTFSAGIIIHLQPRF